MNGQLRRDDSSDAEKRDAPDTVHETSSLQTHLPTSNYAGLLPSMHPCNVLKSGCLLDIPSDTSLPHSGQRPDVGTPVFRG